MTGARVVTPGTGFRSLADVPDGEHVALDARHLHNDFDGEWVEAVTNWVDPSTVRAIVKSSDGHKAWFTIHNHKSLRRIEE